MKKLILLFVLFAAAGCAREAVEDFTPEKTPATTQTKSFGYNIGDQIYNYHCFRGEHGGYGNYNCVQQGVYYHDGNGIVQSSGNIWPTWYATSGLEYYCTGQWGSGEPYFDYVDMKPEYSAGIYVKVNTAVPGAKWAYQIQSDFSDTWRRSIDESSDGLYINYYAYSPYPTNIQTIRIRIYLLDGSGSGSFSVYIL